MNELTIFNATESQTMPYTSFLANTPESATMLFNAMNQAENAVKEFVNMNIEVKNVFVQFAVQRDEETGEAKNSAKVVLFDSEGHTYATTSLPFYTTLCNACSIIGSPEQWVSPIVIKPVQRAVKKGQMLTFEIVSWGENKAGQHLEKTE